MKRTLADLAVLGGEPAFAQPLHVGQPNLPDRDGFLRRIDGILDRNWLTNDGPVVREFEAHVAEHLGVGHCVAMCNGTIALEIAIRALGLSGEVIVPAFTFVATAHALQWQEITPVFCDIDPGDHNLDVAAVERLITPKTTGIIGVHLWGTPCRVDELQALADRRGLTLLLDAAHAFSCSLGPTMVGNFGAAEVLSFHATKFVNSFEGGAIVTNDDELAARARLMRNFGFVGYDAVEHPGTNGKMTEVCAAMGLSSLEAVDDLLAHNEAVHRRYRQQLGAVAGVRVLDPGTADRHNHQYVVLEIDADRSGIGRDAVMDALWAENVRARRYFHPGVHRMEPYRSHFPHAGLLLPVTERVAGQVLVLPTGRAVDLAAVDVIASILEVCCTDGAALGAQLAG